MKSAFRFETAGTAAPQMDDSGCACFGALGISDTGFNLPH